MLYNLLYNIMKSYFWRNPPAQACLPPAIDTDAANLFTTSERLIQEQYVQRLTELQSWKIWSKKSYTTQIFIILLRLIIVRLASQMHAKGLRAYRSSQEGCKQFKKSSILVLLSLDSQLSVAKYLCHWISLVLKVLCAFPFGYIQGSALL